MKKIIAALTGYLPFIALNAQAGTPVPITITFGPAAVGPMAPAAPAAPVPFMDSALLVLLGLMLLVIALRFLRENKTAHKILSVALLGSGLAVGGLGVEKTLAIGPLTEKIAPACESAEVIVDGRFATVVENDCPEDLTIQAIKAEVPPPATCEAYREAEWPFEDGLAPCREGETVAAGTQCTAPFFEAYVPEPGSCF